MNVETHTSPPDHDLDDGDDTPSARVSVHFIRADDVALDTGVQLFGDAADDPERFADALLAAALAAAKLAGREREWAAVSRFADYDGTGPR